MGMQYGNVVAKTVSQGKVDITGSWTALRVGSSNLANRKWIEIYNRSAYKIFLSVDDSSANVRYVKAIAAGDYKIEPLASNLTLYGRTAGSGARVIVTEYA